GGMCPLREELRGVGQFGIKGYGQGFAVDVPRRTLPVLPLPLVHVQPDDLPVGARELRVDVDERLHPVLACRQIRQSRERMTPFATSDRPRRPRLDGVDELREERSPGRTGLLDRRLLV